MRVFNVYEWFLESLSCIFSHQQVQVSIGERHVVGVATGTAIYLSALPPPSLPTPSNPSVPSKQSKRGRIQKLLMEAYSASKERYGLNKALSKVADVEEPKWTDSDESDEDANDLDLTAGNKDSCVIEVATRLVEIQSKKLIQNFDRSRSTTSKTSTWLNCWSTPKHRKVLMLSLPKWSPACRSIIVVAALLCKRLIECGRGKFRLSMALGTSTVASKWFYGYDLN